MRAVLEFLSPFHRRGMYAVPHAIAALIVVAVLAIAGVFAVQTYNAHFYRTRYRAPLRVPHVYQRVHVPPKVAPKADDAGSIHFAYLAEQTADQGSIGSCQAWSFARELSYAANWNRQLNGTHWHRFYSPRFLYDAISNCQDQGSYLEQFPPVVANAGAPLWKQMPYGTAAEALANPLPDFVVDCPAPQWAQTLARLHSLGVTETPLFQNQGAGPGGLALIHQALATHHMVNVDFPVFPGFDQANADGSTVTLPLPGQVDRGGHANSDVKSDPSHNNGNGTFGADLFANQWSRYAGVGADGIRHAGAHNGFVWVSWAFIEKYVWGAAVIHVTRNSPGKRPGGILRAPVVKSPLHAPGPADGGNDALHKPPSDWPRTPTAAAKAGASWYVQGVRLTTGQNVSSLLNTWGDHYHVWPIGLAATAGVESGLNPYAERFAGGLDNSCGLMQQILTNVAYYTGIQGARAECNWEESPANSIYLGARIYAEAFAYQRNCVPWPWAYEMYNRGAGLPCSYYFNPAPDVYQHQQVFLGWYNLALSRWQLVGPPPPPPTPKPVPHFRFNRPRWCRADHRLHLHCPSSYAGVDRLSTTAFQWSHWKHAFHGRGSVDHVCGGVIGRETWHPKHRTITQRFSRCSVTERPRKHGAPTRWHHAPRWQRGMKT